MAIKRRTGGGAVMNVAPLGLRDNASRHQAMELKRFSSGSLTPAFTEFNASFSGQKCGH